MNLFEGKEQTTVKIQDCKTAFVEPGASNMIDLINPITGKSCINGETLEQVKQRYPTAEIVNVDEWMKAKAQGQDSKIEWSETTEAKFYEMLEVLPPAMMLKGGFLVGEPWDHHAMTGQPRFAAYREQHGKFYAANRPMTRSEFKKESETT